MTVPISRPGQVVLSLAMMTGLWATIVSLHLHGSGNSAARRYALLLAKENQQQLLYAGARLQQARVRVGDEAFGRKVALMPLDGPILEEVPGWMGFRSSIDGFNVNQHPSTGPGGAQDHQDPVYYSNGMWPTGTGGTMAKPTNVMGAGGTAYQVDGRDQAGTGRIRIGR